MLQHALDNAVEHGQKRSKKAELNSAKYCLVIHNKQFLYIPDWDEITWPDLRGFDAVMILHDEIIPPVQVWQVITRERLRQNNQERDHRRRRKARSDSAGIRARPRNREGGLEPLEELDITEEDILEAVRETRRTG